MGSHSSFCLDISSSAGISDAEIIAFGNSLPDFKGADFGGWMWRRFSPESKWHGGDGIAREISKKFTGVVFRLRCRGDYQYTSYWLDGNELPFECVYGDPFPSKALFNRRLKQKREADCVAAAAREAAAAKKKADNDAAELQRLRARTAEIEARLAGTANG
jgi:hypothetical protein